MAFQDKKIHSEYRSLSNNVIKEFYIPLLEDAILYKRAVGYFSSSALIELSKGISGLVQNGGEIQLVASPKLSDEDIDAINKGFELREAVIERALINSFTPPINIYEEERLNLLAHLIGDGHLNIKIAYMENSNNVGMFHEKMGLLYDKENNVVAFSGSMNETRTGFSHNYESIDVFCSWTAEKERVISKERAFSAIWQDYEPKIRVVDFPIAAKSILDNYKKPTFNNNLDYEEFEMSHTSSKEKIFNNVFGPKIPGSITLHDYQLEAIENWEKQKYSGIFDMATGTGKTYTALGAISKLYENSDGNLAVFIICPYQHLVEQWVEDINLFGMKPIIGYSSSIQRNWKKRLKDASIGFNLGVKKHFCFVSTNATFSSKFVQDIMKIIKGNVVLVIDEAHNFGAEHLSKTLTPSIPFRLALSATLERHGDKEGTEKLFDFFGEKCIEYSLKQAIDNGKLTPYYYYPIVVNLTDEELIIYKSLTTQLSKYCTKDKSGKIKISEAGKMLLIKRARLVAGASNKIPKLSELMERYKSDSHMLVYCGAATLEDPEYVEGDASIEEKRQIDIVSNLLGNKLGMKVSKFTSEESSEERENLKNVFSEGKHLQTLIAIRCLDEGVNIPSIKTAFILASSTNPKEYIQRRGRVLRKFLNKNSAVIYDFITLPVSNDEIRKYPEEELKLVRSLAYKEITRMKDFASIAENPSDSDRLINEISDAYNLSDLGGYKDEV